MPVLLFSEVLTPTPLIQVFQLVGALAVAMMLSSVVMASVRGTPCGTRGLHAGGGGGRLLLVQSCLSHHCGLGERPSHRCKTTRFILGPYDGCPLSLHSPARGRPFCYSLPPPDNLLVCSATLWPSDSSSASCSLLLTPQS